jgi:hypothetical protein
MVGTRFHLARHQNSVERVVIKRVEVSVVSESSLFLPLIIDSSLCPPIIRSPFSPLSRHPARSVPGIEWWRCLDHIACQALGLVRLADVRDIDQAVLREDTLWLTILLPLQCLTFLAERACNCGAAWCDHETPAGGDIEKAQVAEDGKDEDEKFEDVDVAADADSAAADADVCEGHLARRLAYRALNLLRGLVFVDSSVLHTPPASSTGRRRHGGAANAPQVW